MHEAADRVGFGGIARNAGCFEDRRGGIAASDPHGKHGLWSDEAAVMRLRAGGDRSRGGVCRRERGRDIHDQDGVVLPVLQQRFEGGEVARRIGIAGDVDRVRARPDRRQRRVELLHGRRRERGEGAAEIGEAARVAPSSAKKSSRSPKSTSILSPSETAAEKPMSCAADHSIRPAVMAPDCETRASSPAGGMRAAKLALSLAREVKTRRQFGPPSLSPVARAAFSQASASEPSPCPSPAVMMIAVATPFSPAAATMPGTDGGGVAITSRSGACRSAWMALTALIPSISS